jgi:hypothetical protein
MDRRRRFLFPIHQPRNALNLTVEMADEIHRLEKNLIEKLYEIDRNRFYVWFGYNSLMGFCNLGLRFSKTQSQRIVTQVRRFEPIESNAEP